jgi:hypothetical protein
MDAILLVVVADCGTKHGQASILQYYRLAAAVVFVAD